MNTMQDKTILITGGSGGIGKQTALALAKTGAQVIITGRSLSSGEAAVAEIIQSSANPKVALLLADLSTRAGVHSLVEQFNGNYDHLDVLINNAGLAESKRRLTADGVEADFAVNVVAPFLLTQLLMDRLKIRPGGRVISLTGGEARGRIELDNLQAERSFVGLTTYSHSKLVMMALMYEFALRTQVSGVTINVCYPGQASTTMTRSVTPEMLPVFLRIIWPLFKRMLKEDGGKTAAKASLSSIYLATSDVMKGRSAQYFDTRCHLTAWPQAVQDQAVRQKIWEITSRVAGITIA